jgi:hypothetical protein
VWANLLIWLFKLDVRDALFMQTLYVGSSDTCNNIIRQQNNYIHIDKLTYEFASVFVKPTVLQILLVAHRRLA